MNQLVTRGDESLREGKVQVFIVQGVGVIEGVMLGVGVRVTMAVNI